MKQHQYFVYILVNKLDSVIYIGMTNDLQRRLYEHQHHLVEGFSDKYNVTKLVYVEVVLDVKVAIAREKQLKKWRRDKKNKLVEALNPNWDDLSKGW